MGPEAVVGVLVVDELPADGPAIHLVLSEAFDRTSEAELVDLLRAGGRLAVSLCAWEGARLVGHVALSPLTLVPACALRTGGLGPIAVSPDRQRSGIGSALMAAAISRARDCWDALFLLGDPAYYRRFGFSTAPVGNEYGAGEAFMALELTPGCLIEVRGTARYAPEFGEVGA